MVTRILKVSFLSITLFFVLISCSSTDNDAGTDGDSNSDSDNPNLLFEENFDAQSDWFAASNRDDFTVPPNWDYARTNENWHPDTHPGTQPSMRIGGNSEQVYGGTGKAFVSYSEDPVGRGWAADNILTKTLPPLDELYVEFYIKFQPGFASDIDHGLMKIFRISSYDGVGGRYSF